MTTWFTSDTHFGHKLCARLRGFGESTHAMNEAIIFGWNDVVSKSDRVFILGDICWGGKQSARKTLSRLNGRLYLIRGNHDSVADSATCRDRFEWIRDVSHVTDIFHGATFGSKKGRVTFWLSHYAHRCWPWSHDGVIHLYGHSHGNLPDDPRVLSMDVGIDAVKLLRPISTFEVLTRLLATKNPSALVKVGRRNELPPVE